MDFSQVTLRNKKSCPLKLFVLNVPPKDQLKQIPSPSNQYLLYEYSPKKIMLAAYKTFIPKTKLLSNLQIYEWRCQTQFPIVKTAFVYVKQNQSNTVPTLQITTFNEYCPLKLAHIYQMSTGQVLYILKQSMIGFERLYNRFGSFEIFNSMITINQKGFCRVWLNQNFALNTLSKKDIIQTKMVQKIITILQSYSQQSKISKKLFSLLRNCSSFFNAIKTIDNFVKQQKIYVPTKFIALSSTKQLSKLEIPNLKKKISQEMDNTNLISRFSIKDEKFNKFRELIKDQLKKSVQQRRISSSPLQIKRLKTETSQKTLQLTNEMMKKSDQQTFHTKNKYGKTNMVLPSPNLLKFIEKKQQKEKKRSGWAQQYSYIMGEDQNISKQYGIKKKQMTQSEAYNFGKQANSRINFNSSQRKYSCKISPKSKPRKLKTTNAFNKKITSQLFLGQFDDILNSNSNTAPTIKIKSPQDINEENIRTQVSGSVLKNNGWVANVLGLLDIPNNLEKSFHDGHEENTASKQIKLDKLNNVGKQQMLMSILHQQMEEII